MTDGAPTEEAPEKEAPEKKAPKKKAPKKKRPFLRRVPTSLLVTLLGIALTAWLLPAFTHQWDDRQKAQEVKAAVVSEISVATSQAVVGSKQAERQYVAWYAKHWKQHIPPAANFARLRHNDAVVDRLNDAYWLDSVRFEAKVRAYFPPDVVAHLHTYNNAVAAVFRLAVGKFPDKKDSRRLGLTQQRVANDLDLKPRVQTNDIRKALKLAQIGYSDITNAVLHRQDELTANILSAHVTGYSTTTHDLLSDLIP